MLSRGPVSVRRRRIGRHYKNQQEVLPEEEVRLYRHLRQLHGDCCRREGIKAALEDRQRGCRQAEKHQGHDVPGKVREAGHYDGHLLHQREKETGTQVPGDRKKVQNKAEKADGQPAAR